MGNVADFRDEALTGAEAAHLERATRRAVRLVASKPLEVIDLHTLTLRQQRACDLAGKYAGIAFFTALGYAIRYAILAGRQIAQVIGLGVTALRSKETE